MNDRAPYAKCLFFTANALGRAMTRLADRAFEGVGISPSHGYLLTLVDREPGITPGEAARISTSRRRP